MNWRRSRKTLEDHLRRVIECFYEGSEPDCTCCENREDSCYRGQQIDFIDRARYCPNSGNFDITLHPRFVEEVKQSPRCPMAIVRRFIRDQQFAPLDLYFWYRWALHRSWIDVDPFGENGPYSLLPIACAGPKQRCDLRARHKIVVEYDRDTPFQIVGRGALRRLQQVTAVARRLSSNLPLIARAGLKALARLDQRRRATLPKVKQRQPRRRDRGKSRAAALGKLLAQREARRAAANAPPRPGSTDSPDSLAPRATRPKHRPDRLADRSRPGGTAATARHFEPLARAFSQGVAEVRQATAALRKDLRALTGNQEVSIGERQPGRESGQAMRPKDKTGNNGQPPSKTRERGPP